MEYNSAREQMIIPEYGRNVQKMVQYAATIPDKEQRNSAVQAIVRIIADMNPQMKDQQEFIHKVWDHIYMMADYDLDIDSPFPPPDPETVNEKPERLPYSRNRIRYRYYGKNVEAMINKAMEMEDGDTKDYFINAIASYMKMSYRIWNEEKVSDEIIIHHLDELSGGVFKLDRINELNTNYDTHLGKIHKKDSSLSGPGPRKKKFKRK